MRVKAFLTEPLHKFPKQAEPKKTRNRYYAKPNLNESRASKKTKTTLQTILLPIKLLAKNQLPKEPEIFQNVRLQRANFPKRKPQNDKTLRTLAFAFAISPQL